jgi:hypothetical protein
MSTRPWHRPQTPEVSVPNKYVESVAIACALAVLIVSLRLWKLITRNSASKEE